MRRLGNTLLSLGIAVGVIAAVWVSIGVQRSALSWIVSIALVKLTIVAALGLLAAGAVALRVARKADLREQLGEGAATDLPQPSKARDDLRSGRRY